MRRFAKPANLLFTAAALLVLVNGTAQGTPTLAIDLDPSMGGIQWTLSVTAGTSFGVDVVYIGDGLPSSLFDTVLIDVVFNDMGSVLGLGSPNPTAGC